MKVKTFIGKMGVETLHELDSHVNKWIDRNDIQPKLVTQCSGKETLRESANEEHVLVMSIWY